MRPFEGSRHYLHYLYYILASVQTTGREHSPTYQNKTQFPPQSLPSGSSRFTYHVGAKERQLGFAGAALKRYLMSKVRETQVRQ